MRFDPRGGTDIWSRYLAFVGKLGLRNETFLVDQISAFDNSVDWRFECFVEQVGTKTLQSVADRLQKLDRDRLILRTDMGVFRDDRFDAAAEPIMSSLFLRGPRASWNPTREQEQLNLVWQMGDYKNYDPEIAPVSGTSNWNRLVNEVEIVAGFGDIAEIWGGQESFDGMLDNAFLMYRREGAGGSTRVDVSSDRLGSRRIAGGTLVYSKDGINGSLRASSKLH